MDIDYNVPTPDGDLARRAMDWREHARVIASLRFNDQRPSSFDSVDSDIARAEIRVLREAAGLVFDKKNREEIVIHAYGCMADQHLNMAEESFDGNRVESTATIGAWNRIIENLSIEPRRIAAEKHRQEREERDQIPVLSTNASRRVRRGLWSRLTGR